ncbi:MAG: hypothetical protein [aquatic viral metagenome]
MGENMITTVAGKIISGETAGSETGLMEEYKGYTDVMKTAANIYGLPGVGSMEDYYVKITVNSKTYEYSLRELIIKNKNGEAAVINDNGVYLVVTAKESATQTSYGDSDVDIQCYNVYLATSKQGKVDIAFYSIMKLLGTIGPTSLPSGVSYSIDQIGNVSIRGPNNEVVFTLQNLFYLIAYVELITSVLILLYLLYIKRTTAAIVYFLVDYAVLSIVSLNNGYATVVATLAVGYIEYKEYKEIVAKRYSLGMGIVNR